MFSFRSSLGLIFVRVINRVPLSRRVHLSCIAHINLRLCPLMVDKSPFFAAARLPPSQSEAFILIDTKSYSQLKYFSHDLFPIDSLLPLFVRRASFGLCIILYVTQYENFFGTHFNSNEKSLFYLIIHYYILNQKITSFQLIILYIPSLVAILITYLANTMIPSHVSLTMSFILLAGIFTPALPPSGNTML